MTKFKLFPKIFLSTLLLFMSLIAIIHACIFFLMPQIYSNMKEEESSQKIERLTKSLTGQSTERLKTISEAFAKKNNVSVTLNLDGEQYFFGSMSLLDIDNQEALESNLKIGLPEEIQQSEYVILKTKKTTDASGNSVQVLLLMDVSSIKEARQATLKSLPYTLGFSLICALLFSYVYTRLTIKPIKKMVAVTGEMAQLNRTERYPVSGSDEINLLGSRINDLYENLLETIDSLEEENQHIMQLEKERLTFLRAASHELKTPLTSLRLVVENMALNIGPYKNHDKYLNQSLTEIDKLYAMIQDILMSQDYSEKESYLDEEKLSLKDLIETTLADYHLLAESKGLLIQTDLDDFQIEANWSLMEKVLSNLISNAVHFTPDGGDISISLKSGQLSIKNQCQPIPRETIRKLFEPLYRMEKSRHSEYGGSGMGLYIVKFFLEKKGYAFDFHPYEQGMEFVIQF